MILFGRYATLGLGQEVIGPRLLMLPKKLSFGILLAISSCSLLSQICRSLKSFYCLCILAISGLSNHFVTSLVLALLGFIGQFS